MHALDSLSITLFCAGLLGERLQGVLAPASRFLPEARVSVRLRQISALLVSVPDV